MRARTIVAVVLGVIACLSAATSVVAWWARATALDTDTYVARTDEVFRDEAVQAAMTAYLSEQVAELVGVGGLGRGLVERAVAEVLVQPGLADGVAWLNGEAHERVVAVLRGDSEWARVEGESLVIDLDPALEAILAQLRDWGVPLVPNSVDDGTAELRLPAPPELVEAVDAVHTLDTLAWLLPAVGVVSGLAALAVRFRWSTLAGLGVGTAAAAALVLGSEALARWSVLGRVTEPIDQLAGTSLWDIAGRDLVRGEALLALAGLVVAGAAVLARRASRQSVTAVP